MAENLIHRLVPHQGCVISRAVDGIDVAGSAMNWVMSAAVAPFTCRAPFAFRVVGRTDSTNLRLHWHRGELIFNWECSVRELRVHDPALAWAPDGSQLFAYGSWGGVLVDFPSGESNLMTYLAGTTAVAWLP